MDNSSELNREALAHLFRTKARTIESMAVWVEDGLVSLEDAAKCLDTIDDAIRGKK
jgi:hypothetical protein